jgi:hypothetical protein
MSSDKPPLSISGLTAFIIFVSAIAAPAITYGISQGNRSAEISAIRDRVTVLEAQNAELRKEIAAVANKIGDLAVMTGRIEEKIGALKDSARAAH